MLYNVPGKGYQKSYACADQSYRGGQALPTLLDGSAIQ
jgi:hypothetical protein